MFCNLKQCFLTIIYLRGESYISGTYQLKPVEKNLLIEIRNKAINKVVYNVSLSPSPLHFLK